MKLALLQQVVINSLTLFTALMTFFSVLEMKRQRKESYKPVIVLVKKYFILKSYSDGRYNSLTNQATINENGLSVVIVNAGLGPACNIDLQWDFDFNEFISKNKWKMGSVKFEDGVFSINMPKWNCANYVRNQDKVTIEYLLPMQNNQVPLHLPEFFTAILKLIADIWRDGEQYYLPSLKLGLTYQDIGMKRQTLHYQIEIQPIGLFLVQTEPLLEYEAHFEGIIKKG